MTQEEQLQEL